MAERDLYSVLGVPRGAKPAEIKKAYRTLARELHPDRNPDDAVAEERFKDVSYAYDVLSSEDKRPLYDEFGEVGLKEGFDAEAFRQYQAWQRAGSGRGRTVTGRHGEVFGGHGGGGSIFDLESGLEGLFGMRGRRSARGADHHSDIHIGFADALRGVERELTFGVPGQAESGQTIKVRIPAGVRDGGKVRLRGQGGEPRGKGPRGDLVLTVHVEPHAHFWREGDDLHLNLPVSPLEAHGGAKVRVPTLDGEVSLTIPSRSQGGAKLRLKGKGAQRGRARGDLYVHLRLCLPDADEPRLAELLEELDGLYDRPPRTGIRL